MMHLQVGVHRQPLPQGEATGEKQLWEHRC